VHAVAFSQWICKLDSAGNRMLLQICNGALEPCFCGFCMQLHFCNSSISLKNTIKNYEKNITVFLMPFYVIIPSFKFFRRWIHYSCNTGLRDHNNILMTEEEDTNVYCQIAVCTALSVISQRQWGEQLPIDKLLWSHRWTDLTQCRRFHLQTNRTPYNVVAIVA